MTRSSIRLMQQRNERNRTPVPPARADQLLAWLCLPELVEEMLGDLHEVYYQQLQEQGPGLARWAYLLVAVAYARPWFYRRRKHLYRCNAVYPNHLTLFRHASQLPPHRQVKRIKIGISKGN